MLKVAIIQFAVSLADLTSNQTKVDNLVKEAVTEYQPDIILLPETWNLGFFPANLHELAEDYHNSSSLRLLKNLAANYLVNIVGGSIIVKENNLIHNRAVVINRKGEIVHQYDKAHLFSPAKENQYFAKGETNNVFILDGIKMAEMICYDLRFPEYSRKLALEGAEILFVPAEWPHPRLHHWQILNQARAIENQLFVISANGCGTANHLQFCGHSLIVNPWGEVVAEGDEEERIIFAELDLSLVHDVRKRIAIYQDRNMKVYNVEDHKC